jgi:transposase
MSVSEVGRAQVLRLLDEGHLIQREAAERLNISVRQVKRLLKSYRRLGTTGLISNQRGRPSNHQLDPQTEARALELLRERYSDFGPTLAHEKLTEVHQLVLSRETVRRLMVGAHLWRAHRARRPEIHPLRDRRPRLGELVQLDGSPHAWFEDRAPVCTLLVYIDDATGRLMELWFAQAETTFSYFDATERYLTRHGKPLVFYSDKFSVFRINHPNDLGGDGTTQFTRAMSQLGIEVICANTPEAKGRVERVNLTLQDRLVKEMRLQGISSITEANVFAREYLATFNARFSVVPRDPADAHRPLLPRDDLARILTLQEKRVLSKNLTLQYNKVIYQIQTARPTYALRNAAVIVRENVRGEIAIEYKGKPLPFTEFRQQAKQAAVVTSKQLPMTLDALAAATNKRKSYTPPANHPWRRFQINAKDGRHNPAR